MVRDTDAGQRGSVAEYLGELVLQLQIYLRVAAATILSTCRSPRTRSVNAVFLRQNERCERRLV